MQNLTKKITIGIILLLILLILCLVIMPRVNNIFTTKVHKNMETIDTVSEPISSPEVILEDIKPTPTPTFTIEKVLIEIVDEEDAFIEEDTFVEEDTYIEENSFIEDDLYLLSMVIAQELGSDWVPDYYQQCVASVVLNRVNSSYFPNTIYEVMYQPGQYCGFYAEPTEKNIANARYVLENGSVLPAAVVFQSQEINGEVYEEYYDSVMCNTTYFCYSDLMLEEMGS